MFLKDKSKEWLFFKQSEKLEIRKMGKINIQSRDLVTALHMCFVKQIGKRLDNYVLINVPDIFDSYKSTDQLTHNVF